MNGGGVGGEEGWPPCSSSSRTHRRGGLRRCGSSRSGRGACPARVRSSFSFDDRVTYTRAVPPTTPQSRMAQMRMLRRQPARAKIRTGVAMFSVHIVRQTLRTYMHMLWRINFFGIVPTPPKNHAWHVLWVNKGGGLLKKCTG